MGQIIHVTNAQEVLVLIYGNLALLMLKLNFFGFAIDFFLIFFKCPNRDSSVVNLIHQLIPNRIIVALS